MVLENGSQSLVIIGRQRHGDRELDQGRDDGDDGQPPNSPTQDMEKWLIMRQRVNTLSINGFMNFSSLFISVYIR